MTKKTTIKDPHLDDNPLNLPFEEPDAEPVEATTTPPPSDEEVVGEEEVDFDLEQVIDPGKADASVAAAIAALQQQMATLAAENKELRQNITKLQAEEGEGGLPFMYFKRGDKPDDPMAGWIIAAGGGVSPQSGGRDSGTYSRMLQKGYKPLPRYGLIAPPSAYRKKPGSQFAELLRRGGAKDVPASQVLAYRWHIGPPVPGISFPQYETARKEGKVCHFQCDEGDCSFEQWFLSDDQTTAQACLFHLRQKHEYTQVLALQTLQEMGVPYRTRRRTQQTAPTRVSRELLELDEEE